MVRILHTADLHLGMKFAGYPQVRDRLSAARFDALDRIVESANREQCSLLTIGGDLFDRPRVGAAEVERAAESLSRFEGEAVLVLPGNHDYVAPESELWTRFRRAAGDRTILLDRPEPVDLRPFGPSVALYPAPCTARRSAVNNIGWIGQDSLVQGVELHIGIAHGSLQGLSPDPELNYYPMSREELLSRPVDLWLLGHTHVRYPDPPRAGDRIFNPGTPEPDGFDCSHTGGAFVIELSPESAPVGRVVQTGSFRFAERTVELTPHSSVSDLERAISADLSPQLLLRLELTGAVSAETHAELARVEPALRDRVLHLDVDQSALREAVTPQLIAERYPESSFAGRLLSRLLEAGERDAVDAAFDLIEESRRDR